VYSELVDAWGSGLSDSLGNRRVGWDWDWDWDWDCDCDCARIGGWVCGAGSCLEGCLTDCVRD